MISFSIFFSCLGDSVFEVYCIIGGFLVHDFYAKKSKFYPPQTSSSPMFAVIDVPLALALALGFAKDYEFG